MAIKKVGLNSIRCKDEEFKNLNMYIWYSQLSPPALAGPRRSEASQETSSLQHVLRSELLTLHL